MGRWDWAQTVRDKRGQELMQVPSGCVIELSGSELVRQANPIVGQQFFKNQMIYLGFLTPEDHEGDNFYF